MYNKKEYDKIWKRNHPDYLKNWRKENPESPEQRAEHIKRSTKYQHEHPEKHREYEKRWRKKHPDQHATNEANRRARKRGNGGSHTTQQWLDLVKKYDYRCLCCGVSEPKITLVRDHVVPLVKGGFNDISNIQPLCQSCNSKKFIKTIDFR